jgi:phage anti-repressor protein/predicted GIY-YIG superfamily endonuclease
MKITDFLKSHSLIDSKFIDDFYSFYNEGHNEYDFTINLEDIAFWLELRKDSLKRLLESNFIKGEDYIETKPKEKLSGTGTNNIKIVMLTYTCSKLLCMISKCEKANLIRNYYIELEKLLIKYKDNIVESLERQLGVQTINKKIIENNKSHGIIYVLRVDDEIYKIGKTKELKNRIKQYKVGRLSELPIALVYKTDQMDDIEKCMKDNLKNYQEKNKTELYKIDLDFVKDTIKYCTKKNAILLKRNKKLFEVNNKNWLIIIDKENIENINDLYSKVKRYVRKKSLKSQD